MEISLIRHGRSKHIHSHLTSCVELKNWIQNYDHAGVFEEKDFPSVAIEKITAANIVYTSDLKRAIESAKLLHTNGDIFAEPIFREAELPIPSNKYRMLKFKPQFWVIILRFLWLYGYSSQCESYSKTKQRARKAAQVLVEAAKEHQSVTLVGHGFLNIMIGKELRNRGWKGKRKPATRHWSCTTYKLE